MAGHRSPTGRARTARPVRDRAAHRAPSDGHRRVQVVAAAATFGAVAAGTVTAFASGTPAAADPVAATVDADAGPSPVFAASAGVLQPAQRLRTLTAPAPMLPVAHTVDDEAVDERVASVQKASRLAEQLAAVHAEQARTQALIRAGGLDGWIAEALQVMGLPQQLRPGRQEDHPGGVGRQPARDQHLGQQRPARHALARVDADDPVDVPRLRPPGDAAAGRSPTRSRTSPRASAT